MRSLPPSFAAALPSRYQLGEVIAEGGQARVVAARDLTLNRDVALKVLPRGEASAVGLARFQREIGLLADLVHPGIVPILDAGEAADALWFAMPLLPGRTLAERLVEGPIPEATVRRWGSELADALAAAHRRGVVHRDVKPANVHLVDDHALLADFGVAALAADEELTATGEAVGTTRYMAPEQREGEVDPGIDVYGLGATLIEAVTGRRWHPESPPWETVPRALRPTLRRAVGDRRTRWPSAAALGRALASPGRGTRARWLAAGVVAVALLVGVSSLKEPAPPPGRFTTELLIAAVRDDSLTEELTRATITRLEWFPPLAVAPWRADGIETAEWRVETVVERSPRGDELVLTVRHQSGRTAVLRVPGSGADLPDWGARVAAALVGVVAPERSLEFASFGGSAHRARALWLFYDGQAAFDREAWEVAESAFRAAEAADSGFVQARWWAMQARKWARLPYDDDLEALATVGTLPPPYDALVGLLREPDLRRRIAGLDALARQWPHVAEVQLTRANELFHRGPLVGRPLDSALVALEAAAGTFPALDRPVVWDHVIWGAVRLGAEQRARAALSARRRGAASPDPWGPLLRYAIESRFRPALGRLLEIPLRMAGPEAKAQLAEAYRLALTLDLPGAQLRLAGMLEAPVVAPSVGASLWSARALAALLEGRPAAALRAIDSAAALLPGDAELARQRWEWRLLLPAAGVPIAAEERQRARAAVSASSDERLRLAATIADRLDGEAPRTPGDGATRPAVSLLAALDAAARYTPGEVAIAPASAPALLWHQPADSAIRDAAPFARALGYLWLARGALGERDTTTALLTLAWHEHADLRGWPTGAPQGGELDAALSAVARWQRGGLLIATGHTDEGCRLRARALALWRDAEPGFVDAMRAGEPATWERACRQ